VEIYPVEQTASTEEHPDMPVKSPQHRALGDAIRATRKGRGFTQEGFAAHAEIDRSYYGAIERGEYGVTVETVLRVAAGLDMPAWELLKRAGL
jgi:transcriptional regulator with XRE-family HTH domain